MFDLKNICPNNTKPLSSLGVDTTNIDRITVSLIGKQSIVVTILSKDGSVFKEVHDVLDKTPMGKIASKTVRKFNSGELNEKITRQASLVLEKAIADGRFDMTDKNSTFYYN